MADMLNTFFDGEDLPADPNKKIFRSFNVKIEEELYDKLEKAANTQKLSIGKFVKQMVENYFS